jgi:hypothetical protein
LALAAAAVVLPVGTASAAPVPPLDPTKELLVNPGFERGAASWGAGNPAQATTLSPRASATAKEGSLLLGVAGSGPGASVAQVVTVQSAVDEGYRCAMWVRSGGAAGSRAGVTLALWALGTTAQESSATSVTVGTDWSLVTVSVGLAGAHNYLKCELYLSGGPVEIDAASLMKTSVINSGFEQGTNQDWGVGSVLGPNWKTKPDLQITAERRPDALEGAWLGRVRTTTGSSASTMGIPANASGDARCTAWVKTDSATAASFTLTLAAISQGIGRNPVNNSTDVQVTGSWTKVSAVVPIQPVSSSGVRPMVWCELAPKRIQVADFDVDRVSLTTTGLTNASLDGNTTGWTMQNYPSTVVPVWSRLEGWGYGVSVTPSAAWASLSQTTVMGAGAHRCSVAAQAGSGPTTVQLTAWDLSRGVSSDTVITLNGGEGWRELTSELETPAGSVVRCEIYLRTANVPVELDAASLV